MTAPNLFNRPQSGPGSGTLQYATTSPMMKGPQGGMAPQPVPGATGMTPAPQITPAQTAAPTANTMSAYNTGTQNVTSGAGSAPQRSSQYLPPPTGGPASAPTANPQGGAPPTINPSNAPGSPPQAGGTDLSGVYNFFKSDLQNQQKQALAGTQADAAARGVYYGTPLTGSEADINTQYLRGLGQLQAGMYGNEQQNQLARLAIGTQLMGMMPQAAAGGIDPNLYQSLGQMFLPQQPAPVAAPRVGPAGQVGNQTQSGPGAGGLPYMG